MKRGEGEDEGLNLDGLEKLRRKKGDVVADEWRLKWGTKEK